MEKFLGKYRIAGSLATKASNPVYLARSMVAAKWNVVVKVFTSVLLATPQEQDDFVQQVHLLMECQHYYLLPILDVGVEQEHPYIVSKYATHGSLRHRLNRQTSLTITEGIQIISQVGQALHCIHEHNWLHGNIKPENILFDDHMNTYLADGAFPTLLEDGTSHPDARNGYYLTTELMSKQSDQYALGCVAYELFTGQMPSAAIPFSITQEMQPIAKDNSASQLPEQVEAVLQKAMSHDPAERYDNVAAFIDALNDATLSVVTLPVSSSEMSISLADNAEEAPDDDLAMPILYQGKSIRVTKRTTSMLLGLFIILIVSLFYFLQALPNRPIQRPGVTKTKATITSGTVPTVVVPPLPTSTPPMILAERDPIKVQTPTHTTARPTSSPSPTPLPSPTSQPSPTAVPPPPPQPTAAPPQAPSFLQNPVANPGFETGQLSNWSCNGNSFITKNVVNSGRYALQLANNLFGGGQCTQTIAVQPNHTYTLSAYVRGSTALLGIQGGPTNSANSSNYTWLSVQFTTNASTSSVTIFIMNTHRSLLGSTIYIDNFSVQ